MSSLVFSRLQTAFQKSAIADDHGEVGEPCSVSLNSNTQKKTAGCFQGLSNVEGKDLRPLRSRLKHWCLAHALRL